MKLKVGIIVFPGSNCDHDMYHAFKKILNVNTEFIWHKESNLSSFDIIVLPGGFSYGDYLRAGAIARFSPVMKSVIAQAQKGTCIFGVCNGFQILTESGLLPGSLSSNLNRKFICKDVYIRNENNNTIFSNKIKKDQVLTIPIAHAEGNYYCDEDTYKELLDNNQVIFRYSGHNGEVSTEFNPNGSLYNIAGIMNKEGNVLGMMPHPERNVEKILSNADGVEILSSIVDSV